MLCLPLKIYPMKKLATILTLTFISALTSAQCNGRYQTEIFSSVTKTTVNYSDVYTDNAHKMDIYTPDGDTEINRPLILFMHGGSFSAGDKADVDCQDFCTAFAKKGYVTASVNYRLVSPLNILSFLLNHDEQYEEVLKATVDIKAAIRYFRKDFTNGDTYGIDPNTIFTPFISRRPSKLLGCCFHCCINTISADIPSFHNRAT